MVVLQSGAPSILSSGQVACHFILFIAKVVNLSVEAFMKAMVLLSTLFI